MKVISTELEKHHYMLAMPCYDGKMHAKTATSLINTVSSFFQRKIPHTIATLHGGTLIDATRNELVDTFLESNSDTLVCIDSDMVWDWEEMERLLIYSGHYPLVAGTYTCKQDTPKFIIRMDSTDQNEDGLIPISHAGFGFVAIQRKCLEQMIPFVESYYDVNRKKKFHAFFRLNIKDGLYIGEDVYFFQKAKEAGIQPMLDPLIQLGHMGTKEYNAPFYKVLDEYKSDGESG